MIAAVTRVCLTCRRRLPLSAFATCGGRRGSAGRTYYRHDCRECSTSPFRGADYRLHEQAAPPKPAGECIIRDCREHVSARDDTGVLCDTHLRQYRPLCACGCGREIRQHERAGYRLSCWWRRSEQGQKARLEYRAALIAARRLQRARRQQARRFAAVKRAAARVDTTNRVRN